jgi:hypothetical protein
MMVMTDQAMEDLWKHLEEQYDESAAGELRYFEDADVLDGWALPVKAGDALLTPENGSGWALAHIRAVLERDIYANPDSIVSLPPSGKRHDVVLSFPGGYTYGHWFIDIVPRLELVLRHHPKKELAFIVPGPLPPWTAPFLEPYEIAPDCLIQVGEGQRYHSRNLLLPRLGRNSDYLPRFPHLKAFQTLRSAWLPQAGRPRSLGARLLVRHSPQTSAGHRARLANFDATEESLRSNNFITITPAEMTHCEQVAAFSAAEIVVGENSSALHNIVYGDRTRLIVLNGEDQINLLHLSISKLLGHQCNYLVGKLSDPGHFTCDLNELLALVHAP